MKILSTVLFSPILFLSAVSAIAQTAQKGELARPTASDKLRFEYVLYRPARWEQEKVKEQEVDRVNRGGMISVYFSNASDAPLDLAHYRCNGKDESFWRLGGSLAWDRLYDNHLEPGRMTVLEINAVTEDFAEGKPFSMTYIDRKGWRANGRIETELRGDPVQVSFIRILPGMKGVEIHVRHRGEGEVELESIEIAGSKVVSSSWLGAKMRGPATAIGRVELESALAPASPVIVRIGVKEAAGNRAVFAHRRAFEDYFPIGTWSNKEGNYTTLRQHHIETVVRGGRAEDPFFSRDAAKFGFRTMTPVESLVDIDTLRSLADHPAVACWMLSDEPDWSQPPLQMLVADRMARRYNSTKPTFITLCRSPKFFEYAPISDIPCMDHYSVTAPSNTVWPHRWGTRLEETGIYTHDLKVASEPKPIWIWTQGIADWGERLARPVPTPEELAAQLALNLAEGAKGILWFNFELNKKQRYPEVFEAMQGWGRVLKLTREGLLGAEPLPGKIEAPETIKATALASADRLFVFAINLNYKMDPKAYQWTRAEDAKLSVPLPSWLSPKSGIEIAPDGVRAIEFKASGGRVSLNAGPLAVCRIFVFAPDSQALDGYQKAYAGVLAEEKKGYGEASASN